MEIIQALLLAISPFLVTGITALVKPSQSVVLYGYRTTVLRFGVALLSFGAVVGTAFLTNQPVDTTSVSTFVDTFLVFMTATGTYFWAKYRKATAKASF